MAKLRGANLGAQLQAFAQQTEDKLEDVDRAFKLGLFSRVVMGTRVDTGRMRGNWQVSTGAPISVEVQEFQKVGGLRADQSAKIQPFSATYLTNNVPYVRVWEERDGMVGSALADALRQLDIAVKEAK